MNYTTASSYRSGRNITLANWNDAIASTYLVNTISLCFGLLIGICGNFLVILIYSHYVNKNHKGQGRFFILPLAYVDLMGLTITISLNLIRNTRHVLFPGNFTCKLLLFGSYVVGCTSLFLLTCIAFQRYRKICRPFSRQMTKQHLRSLLLLCLTVGMLLNIPSLFYYGTTTTVHPLSTNLTGTVCQKVVPGTTLGLRLYQGVGAVVSTINVGCIAYLYLMIAKTIFRKGRLKTLYKNRVPEQQSSTLTSNTMEFEENTKSATGNPHKKKDSIRRLSVMFMILSISAILSYIPSWVLIAIETNNSEFWNEMSPWIFQVCLILRRMYIFNHLSNPFIYGIFDFEFRGHVRRLFCPNQK